MPKIDRWERCEDIRHQRHGQWGGMMCWHGIIWAGPAKGCFFEAGANDPIVLSQTYFLEQQGWRGALVEPVPSCCESLREVRTGSRIYQAALGSPGQKGMLRLRIPQGQTELTQAL